MVSGEKDDVYASKLKYKGYFNFKDFYGFCYNWLTEELGMNVTENEYSEKITGPTKEVAFKWTCKSKVTDYFAFEIKLAFRILQLSEVEINKGGVKVKTNSGDITIKLKAILIKDYDGKFETSGRMKIWRGIYEKWIISQRVTQFEDKLTGMADDFLGQAKAFLDLEGADK